MKSKNFHNNYNNRFNNSHKKSFNVIRPKSGKNINLNIKYKLKQNSNNINNKQNNFNLIHNNRYEKNIFERENQGNMLNMPKGIQNNNFLINSYDKIKENSYHYPNIFNKSNKKNEIDKGKIQSFKNPNFLSSEKEKPLIFKNANPKKLKLKTKNTDNELHRKSDFKSDDILKDNIMRMKSEGFSSKNVQLKQQPIKAFEINESIEMDFDKKKNFSEEGFIIKKNEKLNMNDEQYILQNDLKEKIKLIEKLNKENEILKERNNTELLNEKNKVNEYEKILEDKENEISMLKIKYQNLEDELNKKEIEITEKKNEINQILNKSKSEKIEEISHPHNSTENKSQQNFQIKSLEEEYKIKKEEMDKRMEEIIKRENEFNKRISFYEDKELYLEQENEKIINKNIIFNKMEEENNLLKKELSKLKLLKNISNKNPLKSYKKPTLIGLENIGSICFINASLQCLSQTEPLTEYFLKDKNKEKIFNNNIYLKEKNSKKLSPCYYELIQNLWNQNSDKPYNPNKFITRVNDMNTLFKKGEAGDSKDFIIFILEQIHKELKTEPKNNSNEYEFQLNQYDKHNTLQNFFNDFKNEVSIISDIFFGFIETTNECQKCKFNFSIKNINNPIIYNYQIFNSLIFPLEEVKNMKNKLIQNFNNNTVTLNDCFSYYTQSNLFNGQNQNYCNICRQLSDSVYTTRIYSGPNILIIILNRGRNNIYNIKLDFNETIDLTQFIIKKDMPLIIYSLYGVITHIGESGPNAHFVASCKSPIDENWYRYNDSMVNLIKDIKKDIIDFGSPYILFYQKNKIK